MVRPVSPISGNVVHFLTDTDRLRKRDCSQVHVRVPQGNKGQEIEGCVGTMLDIRPVKRKDHPFTSLKALTKNSKSQDNKNN